MRAQSTALAKLLQFNGASVIASYDDYQYRPRITVKIFEQDDSSLQLVLGRGQRVLGFGVQGSPSRLVKWYLAIFGDRARGAFSDVVDIDISDQKFGDADVSLLLKFDQIRALYLSDTRITDGGVAELRKLKRLTALELSSTQITDEAFRYLNALDDLRELDVSGTEVSQCAIEQFEKRHPKCVVYH